MHIRVLDVETSDLPENGGEIIELGWTDIRDKKIAMDGPYRQLVYTSNPIAVAARAVHHLSAEDIEDAPLWAEVRNRAEPPGVDVLAAHNAAFEKQLIATSKPWICTMKCAKVLWPDAPGYSNQVLRYWLELELDQRAMPPHAAGPDTWVTAHILLKQLEERSVEDLIYITDNPIFLSTLPFGKHKGERSDSVPTRYLQWILKNIHDDEDVRYTASMVLKGRNL